MTHRWRVICTALLIAAGMTLIATPEAQGDDSVTPMCNGQPCAAGWYTSPVTLTWSISPPPDSYAGCSETPASPRDVDVSASCTASWSGGQITRGDTYTLQVEISNPTVTATAVRPPDSNGWYNHPVAVAFDGSSFSGIASCTPTATYDGPNAISTTVAGGCTDNAGKSVNTNVALNYDATAPTMTGAVPSRRPDFNGWYNHPVSFRFTGTDPVSGIAGCSTVNYSGPTAGGSVVGSCIDEAGNVATLAVPLRYSATPPPLDLHISAGDQTITLRWQKTSGLSSFTIWRSPGLDGQRTSVVAHGGLGAFTDSRVQNGVRYSYTIRARDHAGNVAARTVHATPGIRLLSPLPGSQLTSPPRLRWTAVLGATYYNVQLFRGGEKILSTWPSGTSLRLSGNWSFRNSRFRLRPGRYRWYVWPGFGARAAARYGPMIGTGTFTVIARR